MAARLTDRQKKKILADYMQTNNYCATAKINGVSATTVKNLVRANADIVEKCEQKKEENTADVLAYMDKHKDLVCAFIGKRETENERRPQGNYQQDNVFRRRNR